MPRKRSQSWLIEVVARGRWPVAAMSCAVCFVVGFVVVPSVLASNVVFRGLAPLVQNLSLVAVVALAAVAIFEYVRETKSRLTVTPGPLNPGTPSVPTGPDLPATITRAAPTEWSLGLLQSIEWKRFEDVVAAYFRAKNFRCETIAHGPDGGVDGRLYFGNLADAVGIVQCKAWGSRQVGVAPVRELLGVMAHEKVGRGYFCATGDFSKEAIAFAAANPIKLISGRDLLDAIAQMPAETRRTLLAVSTTGDYTTPTCPSCGIKLVARTIGGKAAWGCRNYPRCRTKIFRKTDRAESA